ncbi:MAG: ATP-binding protein [Clostridiales bacterium]|nr:ATP-binding protein [Clostridiales bacterium]
MPLDGKLLAQARERLAAIKQHNEETLEARRRQVYARVPETAQCERALRSVMAQLLSAALRPGAEQAAKQAEQQSLALQQRRTELLTANGYPADYIDEIYSCARCRDTGFVDGRPCQCLLALYDQAAKADLSSLLDLGGASFERFRLDLYPDTPGEDGGSARAQMELVFLTCRAYARNFSAAAPNLLFRGGPGLGKTYLSACIAGQVQRQGFSVVYDTAVSALDAFETQKFARDTAAGEEAASRVRRMLRCDLMILDDLGTEMPTSFAYSALYTLVNTRLLSHLPTIISTNLSAEELRRRCGTQVASRLEGEFIELPFVGRDIRQLPERHGPGTETDYV